jgi:hypothetical protein
MKRWDCILKRLPENKSIIGEEDGDFTWFKKL